MAGQLTGDARQLELYTIEFLTSMSMDPLPWPYYYTFAIYEPLLAIVTCIWAFANPREVYGEVRGKADACLGI